MFLVTDTLPMVLAAPHAILLPFLLGLARLHWLFVRPGAGWPMILVSAVLCTVITTFLAYWLGHFGMAVLRDMITISDPMGSTMVVKGLSLVVAPIVALPVFLVFSRRRATQPRRDGNR